MEYFSKDDVLNLLNRNSITKKITLADGVSIYDSVKNLPTADVVPKSEVEKLENAFSRAIRKADQKAIVAIQNAKQEVAREIFEEIDKIMHGYRVNKLLAELGVHIVEHGEPALEQRIAELKKKYTESEG